MRRVDAGTLVLEPQVASHADEMFAVLCDPAIYEFENEPPASVEWLRERFRRLESRRSGDGVEEWLNWVIRLPGGPLAGYVQATVRGGRALIAYELSSAYWGRGIASCAVRAMLDELAMRHGVEEAAAVFKRRNQRSQRLLERLGFEFASPHLQLASGLEDDEALMRMRIRASATVRPSTPGDMQ